MADILKTINLFYRQASSADLPFVGQFTRFEKHRDEEFGLLPLRKTLSPDCKSNWGISEFAAYRESKYLILGGSTASGLYSSDISTKISGLLQSEHNKPSFTLAMPSHNILNQLILYYSLHRSYPGLGDSNLVFYIGVNEILGSMPSGRLGHIPTFDKTIVPSFASKRDKFYLYKFISKKFEKTASIKLDLSNLENIGKNTSMFDKLYLSFFASLLGKSGLLYNDWILGLEEVRNRFESFFNQYDSPYCAIRHALDSRTFNDDLARMSAFYDATLLRLDTLLDISIPLLSGSASKCSTQTPVYIFLQRPFLFCIDNQESIIDSIPYLSTLENRTSLISRTRFFLCYVYMASLYRLLHDRLSSIPNIRVFTGDDFRGHPFSKQPRVEYVDHCHLNDLGYRSLCRSIAECIDTTADNKL